MSGKLARIEAQEREMLAKMGLTYTQPIERVVQSEWTEVKSKKRSKKERECDQTNLSDPVEEVLHLADYHSKSKKKAKKLRKLDNELAQAFGDSLSTLQEAEIATTVVQEDKSDQRTDEVCTASKAHKKKSKKDKQSINNSDNIIPSPLQEEVSSSSKKSSKRKRLVSEAQDNTTETITDVTDVRKKSKKHKLAVDLDAPATADDFKKCAPPAIDHKAAKIQRKKDRQLRRLAKEMDREMLIE